MRDRLNLTLPVEMIEKIKDLSERKNISRSAIAEAAIASFLSPDHADQREAAFARRMDRLSRQVQRLERDLGVTAETVALFVRFWLTITPPLPSDAHATAQAKGRERYEGFIETLGKRLQTGQSFLREIPDDINGGPPAGEQATRSRTEKS
ncbi:CopG family transcriptional regulator [Agrobacterium radiobacter]|uniref:CopG family transcriptional regulator n=1 Tax=Agrobacterium radiobacter TaxID=362 RepID=UPI003F850EFF